MSGLARLYLCRVILECSRREILRSRSRMTLRGGAAKDLGRRSCAAGNEKPPPLGEVANESLLEFDGRGDGEVTILLFIFI